MGWTDWAGYQGLLFSHMLQRSFGSTMLAHLFWIDDNFLWDCVGNDTDPKIYFDRILTITAVNSCDELL